MTTRVTDANVYTDLNSLTSLKRGAKDQDPATLREVARQFESVFARMVLKSMREASFGDSLLGSDQQDFYRGMFDDQLAMELTKGKGLGLADMLVRQLTQPGVAAADANAQSGTAEGDPKAIGAAASGAQTTAAGRGPTAAGSAGAGASFANLSGSAEIPSARATGAWQPSSREEFVDELWPAAQAAGAELGVDPRSLLAQAALETNWGRSMPQHADGSTSFNLFGIKAGERWTGKAAVANTIEIENGVAVNHRERFRAYDSPAESFRDYVSLLRNNPRYADALNTGGDTRAFATALQRAGYATDPSYAQKVMSIAQNMASSSAALKSAANLPMTTGTRTL
jgi:peptidoglycan hydrolase FlgJ